MACSKDAGAFWFSREEAVCGRIFDKARSKPADIDIVVMVKQSEKIDNMT
jgi:hypothetical protein